MAVDSFGAASVTEKVEPQPSCDLLVTVDGTPVEEIADVVLEGDKSRGRHNPPAKE